MKIPRRQHAATPGIDMTPMIDVVFQLIIFFLVSGHMMQQEAQVTLVLPTSATGQPDRPSEQPRLTINVLESGAVQIGNRLLALEELPPHLRQLATGRESPLEVRIRSAGSTPYERLSPVMIACAQAGVWNISLAVYRPEDAP